MHAILRMPRWTGDCALKACIIYLFSNDSRLPEKTKAITCCMRSCRWFSCTPLLTLRSHRHVAWPRWKVHSNLCADGHTCRIAPPSASLSSVMMLRGPATPRPLKAESPTRPCTILKPRAMMSHVSDVVTKEPVNTYNHYQ